MPVYFPPGNYLVTQQIKIVSDRTVFGAGKNSSTILNDISEGVLSIEADRVTIAHLGFKRKEQDKNFGYGIDIKRYYAILEDCLFEDLHTAIRVIGEFYWTIITNCQFFKCSKGFESLMAVNGTSIIGSSFFTTQKPIEINGSDGVSIVGCRFENFGPRFTNCKEVAISGGFYKVDDGTFYAKNSSLDIRGAYWPSNMVADIDSATFAFSHGMLPAIVKDYEAAEVAHRYQNIFPDPECKTDKAVNAWTGYQGNPEFNKIEIKEEKLHFSSTTKNARAAFKLPSGIIGAGIYCKIKAEKNTDGSETEVKIQFLSPSDEFGFKVIKSDDSGTWHKVRFTSSFDQQKDYYLYLAQQSSQGTILIDELLIVPYKAHIGSIDLSSPQTF